MPCKTYAALIVSPLLVSMPLAAQETTPDPIDDIVVEGVREREQAVETMTRAITRRARYDKPISKFYSQVCFGVMGMKADYARTLIARMEETAREIDVPVGGDGCLVNVLVAFVRDGAKNLDDLREAEPKLFATLRDYEYERIKLGNGAVQAWHGTHVKGKDGREFTSYKINNIEVLLNSQYSSSRLTNQVRVEMTGAIIVIDSERVPGKTLQQLADYAAMRTFVSINDTTGGRGYRHPHDPVAVRRRSRSARRPDHFRPRLSRGGLSPARHGRRCANPRCDVDDVSTVGTGFWRERRGLSRPARGIRPARARAIRRVASSARPLPA